MPTPFDVTPSLLIEKLAQYLKNNIKAVYAPDWSKFVKTSVHTEALPTNEDWWYIRCASILRKLYIKEPIGVGHLRFEYGGKKDYGVRPEHKQKSSGIIIRKAIQQLEEASLVKTYKNEGRIVTSEGRKLLDTLSTNIKKELEKKIPQLKKY